jgi:hypothetical protein
MILLVSPHITSGDNSEAVRSQQRFSNIYRPPCKLLELTRRFLTGTKKPALAFAKSGHILPSLASIYIASCKLSSNQRLNSVYAHHIKCQPHSNMLNKLNLSIPISIKAPCISQPYPLISLRDISQHSSSSWPLQHPLVKHQAYLQSSEDK